MAGAWHEPYVGLLFGSFIHERLEGNSKLLNNPSFIMADPPREAWLNSIRNFVIEGAAARYPNLKKGRLSDHQGAQRLDRRSVAPGGYPGEQFDLPDP